MAKRKKKSTFKKKKITHRHKPKGKPPQALRRKVKAKPAPAKRKKKRAARAQKPPEREIGLLDAISEVVADCADLASEMHDWQSNLEEKFSSTQKYDDVGRAADELDEIENQDPTADDDAKFLNAIMIRHQDPTPRARGYSRADRLSHAGILLGSVIDRLEELHDDEEHDGKEFEEQELETIKEVKDACENMQSTMDGVEFPGKYG